MDLATQAKPNEFEAWIEKANKNAYYLKKKN